MQLSRLKKVLENLLQDCHWVKTGGGSSEDLPISWLVTDGTDVFLRDHDGYVDLMRKGGQRSFAFVIEVSHLRDSLIEGVRRECKDKAAFCSYEELPPI